MRRVFALSVALLFAGPAGAVCFPEVTELEDSALVVTAQVADEQSIVDPGDPEGFAGTRYTMRIVERLKGTPPASLVIFSENSSGRFPMARGRTYLLFLGPPRDGVYSVNNCGQSGDAAGRSDIITALRRAGRTD